jgi:protein arginine N-methyltransferase 1
MYSLPQFGGMMADTSRFLAYQAAIARAVGPGDSVVDLGSGPGVFAMLACRAGARRVYAIESEEVIEVARQLAAANGFADRIEFLQADSQNVKLPERVNVIVSDVRGALPLFRDTIRSLDDARLRFLADGGRFIPQRDTLYAAVVEAEPFYTRITSPWQTHCNGLDFSLSLPLILNIFYQEMAQPEQLLTERKAWGTLDYVTGANPRASADLTFCTVRSGTAHGICLWFDAQLFEDIGFSSSPGELSSVYGHIMLPFLKPVVLQEGQKIEIKLSADPVGGEYIWRWNTTIAIHDGTEAVRFEQSTFQGATLSGDSLRKRASEFVPVLSEAGQAEQWLLQAMDGKRSLQEIAQAAAGRFPNVFKRPEQAFQRAVEIAGRLSR